MAKRMEWEREIIDHIIKLLEVPNGDAQGVFEAHPFEVAQGWTLGSSPLKVAQKICRTGE